MATDREFLAMRGIKRHLDTLEDDHGAQKRVINWVVDKVAIPNKSLAGQQPTREISQDVQQGQILQG